MKRCYWGLCLVLSICLLLLTGVQPVYAARGDGSTVSAQKSPAAETIRDNEDTNIITNPLYKDILDEKAVADEIALLQRTGQYKPYSEASAFQTVYEAAEYVKSLMVNRSNIITFVLDRNVYDIEVWRRIFDQAIAHTEECSGKEGDALAWVWGGVSERESYDSNGNVRFMYTITYYTTLEQENDLTAAVDTAMKEMALEGKTEYEKVKTIYEYICDHVNYDYTSEGTLKHTAYAAMCKGEAVCQGYAVLFYRMCKETGLSVRVITGDGGGPHAWNIVRVGDFYYNMDSTWDGQDDELRHDYFLKNEEDFIGHVRDDQYADAEFQEQYPIAPESWVDYSAYESPFQLENLSYIFNTIDGGTVTSSAEGRPKLLLFYVYDNTSCIDTISSIRSLNGIDMIAVETSNADRETVAELKDAYGSDAITFAYSTDGSNDIDKWESSIWEYVRTTGIGSENGIYLPVLVYIDADNRIQYATDGYCSAGTVAANIAYYLTDMDITFGEEAIGLELEDEYAAAVYVNGIKKNNSIFSWESSDESIASVDERGRITGVSIGNCLITCRLYGEKYAECKVTVSKGTYTGLKQRGDDWVYYENGDRNPDKNGLVLFDGAWFFVSGGIMDKTKNGFVEYEGESFYVAGGQLLSNVNGLVLDGNEWYFAAEGRWVKEFSGFAEYDSHWFVLNNGKLDTTYNDIYYYNGGMFLTAAGQIQYGYSGLYYASDGTWYFIANGQVSSGYTGLTFYDGQWFYIRSGVLAVDFTGWVDYDGSRFYVINGMVQP